MQKVRAFAQSIWVVPPVVQLVSERLFVHFCQIRALPISVMVPSLLSTKGAETIEIVNPKKPNQLIEEK
ncbi:hypothetical protein LEP1GSC127_0368 [Leptospira kirschneri str. 200801925]|nr:hypothetical protein LEP1GSC127_0368 [Leptospira kirschneri str. 200801925]